MGNRLGHDLGDGSHDGRWRIRSWLKSEGNLHARRRTLVSRAVVICIPRQRENNAGEGKAGRPSRTTELGNEQRSAAEKGRYDSCFGKAATL